MERQPRWIRAAVAGALLAAATLPLAGPRGVARAADGAVAMATPGPERAARVDRELDEIESLLAQAQFHTALGLAASTRKELEDGTADPELALRRARLEVLAATAEVALGRRARARDSLRRALGADPTLRLDERRTSPKVIEALREARARGPIGATP